MQRRKKQQTKKKQVEENEKQNKLGKILMKKEKGNRKEKTKKE